MDRRAPAGPAGTAKQSKATARLGRAGATRIGKKSNGVSGGAMWSNRDLFVIWMMSVIALLLALAMVLMIGRF
jgi:hypothetical protein